MRMINRPLYLTTATYGHFGRTEVKTRPLLSLRKRRSLLAYPAGYGDKERLGGHCHPQPSPVGFSQTCPWSLATG